MKLLRVFRFTNSNGRQLPLNFVRSFAKMDRYKFVAEPQQTTETYNPRTKPNMRKFLVTPAGKQEHTPNPVPPKLRDQNSNELQTIPIENQKSITVALIGPPNVGKSTLLNKFIKDKVSATSSKAQTTRTQVIGCTTVDDTQIVFIDTPGIVEHNKQKNIHRSLLISGWAALEHAELVLVMGDASRNFDTGYYTNFFQVLDSLNREHLQRPSLEAVAVLNKVDKILPAKKRSAKLDSVTAQILNQYPFLKRCFPVSLRAQMNLDVLQDFIISKATKRAWEYPPNVTCYMSDYQRVMEVIREKIYRRLNKELPYIVEQRNIDWSDLGNGITRVENYLYVDTPSHQKILVGAGGSTLKYICNEAEQTLQEIFGRTFKIILCAKVRKSTSATFNFQNRTTAEELLGYRLSPSQPLSDIQDE